MEKHDELIEALGALTHDPLAFVYFAYPWGEPGTPLEDMEGPDEWQIQILKDIGEQLKKGKDLQTAIQEAVASGHGIGKSALISWLIHFAISTHENTRGVVTANTEGQLRTKTWPELSKWHNMFIAKDLFTYTATAIFSSDKDYEKTWRMPFLGVRIPLNHSPVFTIKVIGYWFYLMKPLLLMMLFGK